MMYAPQYTGSDPLSLSALVKVGEGLVLNVWTYLVGILCYFSVHVTSSISLYVRRPGRTPPPILIHICLFSRLNSCGHLLWKGGVKTISWSNACLRQKKKPIHSAHRASATHSEVLISRCLVYVCFMTSNLSSFSFLSWPLMLVPLWTPLQGLVVVSTPELDGRVISIAK